MCDRGADFVRFFGQLLGRGELAGVQMDACSQVECHRELGQRAGIAGELDVPG